MSVYSGDEKVTYETSLDVKKEILSDLSSRINKGGEPPTATMEAEKRIRREIANSNERRRMQSINNGFQSLRSLLPHHEGEKLSKAAILQQTAEYIYNLEQEKTRLLSQNCQLKRLVNQHEGGELPPKKRRAELIAAKIDTAEEATNVAITKQEGGQQHSQPISLIALIPDENTEIRRQLDEERNIRIHLEKQIQQMENQLYELQQQLQQTSQIYHVEENEELALQLVAPESVPVVGHTQTVVMCSTPGRSRSVSPEPMLDDESTYEAEPRIPSVLEAAIKAEPKVEVERLPSPHQTSHTEENTALPGRFIPGPNRSRQNLETIVEAIRHLEGDHMFGDEPQQPQDAPLELTTSRQVETHRLLQADMGAFLDFRHQQQSRPGVIVVKQAS